MLRPMVEADLDMVRIWRNNPVVRANMYTTHEITPEEHRAWWARLLATLLRATSSSRIPEIPLAWSIQQHQRCQSIGDLGVLRKGQRSQRRWRAYGSRSLEYGVWRTRTCKAQLRSFVPQSARSQDASKIWFRIEGVFRKHHVYDGQRLDVYRLAMQANDWHKYLAGQADEILKLGKPTGQAALGARFEHEFRISEEQIEAFARLSGDVNPIHMNAAAAIAAGFEGGSATAL